MSRAALIYKVISNSATEAEKKELDQWLELSPENKEEFNNLKALLEEDTKLSAAQNLDGFIAVRKQMLLKKQKAIKSKGLLIFTLSIRIVTDSVSVTR
jgi:ferric-dicitrate binding protein FerR (iron transport regulator)